MHATTARLKRSQSELKRLTDRFEIATSNAKLGIWEYSLITNQAIWDQNTRHLFGADNIVDLVPDIFWENCLHPDDKAWAIETCITAIEAKKNFALDYRIILPSGEVRHVRCRAGYRFDETNGPRVIGVVWDISEDVRQAEELRLAKETAEQHAKKIESYQRSLEYNALHDALTGLPNRRKLDKALSDISAQTPGSNGEQVALLHIDLDRFKQINDTLGHMAGDTILKVAAGILRSHCAEEALVSRIGGDEFVILFAEAPTVDELSALSTRLLQKLSEPVVVEGVECFFGASIGIAISQSGAVLGSTLLVNSDIALYQAKSEGRNRFCFFNDDMQRRAVAHKKCADDIKRGLERNEFFAMYQPQFDVRDNDIIGLEALVRWHNPERGLLLPEHFLSVAQDINALAQIDEIILKCVLADAAKWRAAGLTVPNISVNVSVRRICDVNLIETLRALELPESGLSFELVESIFLDNKNETVARNVSALKEMGIGIEIDDFGTGHASIAGLLNLRPNRLKIDRQLVQPIVTTIETRRLLGSIVDIGQALGIEILAEGVESREHARILAGLDCNFVQGFAFAPAMEADVMC
ncbi:MAG: putative bifunctional diguanylate cyclase/phosphodiesterase, partial [Rhizobiaceae bacterium]